MDGLNGFQVAACQRWSFRRVWLVAKLRAHCMTHLHSPVTIWGDCMGLMRGEVRRGSWVVTYLCMQCNWGKPKGQ